MHDLHLGIIFFFQDMSRQVWNMLRKAKKLLKKPHNRRTLFSSRHSPVFSFGEIRPCIVYFSYRYRIYRKGGRRESYRKIPRYYITCSTPTKQNWRRKEGRKGPFLPFPLIFGYTGAHWEVKSAGNESCMPNVQ